MNAIVFRLPLVWLVGMGLVACGAAGETPSTRGASGSTAGTTNGEGDGPLLLGGPLANPEPSEGANAGDDPPDDDADELDDDRPGCDCETPTEGVDVSVGGDGITVVVDLPGVGAIKIDSQSGSCATTGTGVDIEGDVTIDVGTGLPIPLVDADLHIEMGSGLPTLSGTANVDGSLLDGIGCGCSEDLLPVEVSLDTELMAELPGAAGGLAVALNLPMNSADVDAGALPLGIGTIVLGDVDVTIASDGQRRVISIAGQVAGDADVWAASVPLQATASLDAVAMIADDELLSVQVQGGIHLQGGELWCGVTPLRSLAMPDALVTLDRGGLWLHATAQASAHPGFSVTGNALVDARFTPHSWSVTVCADVMSDIISATVKIGQCVEMTPDGAVMCDCHRDDEGHCDGGSDDGGYPSDESGEH
jgi:hypothetical protein